MWLVNKYLSCENIGHFVMPVLISYCFHFLDHLPSDYSAGAIGIACFESAAKKATDALRAELSEFVEKVRANTSVDKVGFRSNLRLGAPF